MVECQSMTTLMEMNFKKLCGEVVGPNLENPFEHRQLIGALKFLVNTRPNICFAVNTLRKLMTKPLHAHWVVAKHVLRSFMGLLILD